MSTLKLQASKVFEELWSAVESAKYRIIILKGGSRSSKTWSVIQCLLLLMHQQPRRITAWRYRRTWNRATAYADFIAYTKRVGIYSTTAHNKSELTYHIQRSSIEFNGLDDAQKLHGYTQDVAWVNEAIEAAKNDIDQLEMRTRELIILDYNPTEEESWIYELEKRPDVLLLHSTQKDNPFLEQAVRNKILSYEPTPENVKHGTADPYKWSVYGLGKAARKEGLIYPRWEVVPEWPSEARLLAYGLDFGFFPDPSACARVGLLNGRLVIDELFYESRLNNIRIASRPELPSIQQRLEECGVGLHHEVVADSAAKSSIAELRAVRYNVQAVQKYPGSLREGIELTQQYLPFYVTERSLNLIKELKNYCWRKNFATGGLLNEPVDDYNHLLDLVRYVVQTKAVKPHLKGARVKVLKARS